MTNLARRVPCCLVCVALALTIAPGGCRRASDGESASTQPAAQPLERRAERGPVRMSVRLNKDRITIAEPFELTLEVEAEPDVDVTMPKLETSLQQFSIRDVREQSPRADQPVAPRRVWRQTYLLDSFVSGKFEIPGPEVRFTDRRRSLDSTTTRPAIASTISTEPLPIEVNSLLEGEFDPTKFNDIKGPVSLPRPRSYAIAAWAAGAVAAVLIAAMMVRWYRRRRREADVVRIPPHQWAMMELERLLAEDLIGRGAVTEFYYRLNAILRQYVELRFGLAAAEQTSEEFLRALQDDPRLPLEHKPALRGFIAACDPVKYARYQPLHEEIENVFNTARDFIVQTRQRERDVELAPIEAAA